MEHLFPKTGYLPPHCYIFARTVPCPDTQHPTPLVPDWHLIKTKTEYGNVVAEPVVDKQKGTWSVRIRDIGRGAGQLREVPRPTYKGGSGISLFTGHKIDSDYIKVKAQAGEMGSALYAIAIKTPDGLTFQPPEAADLRALKEAEKELTRLQPGWEKAGIIPTEKIPDGDKTKEALVRGIRTWADMFSPRQLLCFGVLVEELQRLRKEVVKAEGQELGEAVVHMLALVLDKFANWNAILSSWNAPARTARSVFDRHDYAFKATHCEMAPCHASVGFDWAISSTLNAYEAIAELPRHEHSKPCDLTQGSATTLSDISSGSLAAVVVDPPYADNVQYSELADFFYVWLKRTQGHRRPEWFSTYLCDHADEAVVNISRHRDGLKPKEAKALGHEFYQRLMTDAFKEAHRVLRDDGVLTVMFTHKKQEAWEALFASLIQAGFMITATWPVRTEGWHALNIAKKNAAESTVVLVARKRPEKAGVGYFDQNMRSEIQRVARHTAERLKAEGLNAVDQLVGSFGPAMQVFSRFDEVRTDVGGAVPIHVAIDEASDAVSEWRIEQLAMRGLEGVQPEGKFYLLCWDVLGAAQFRFNEASLLGKAVGMDVETLVAAGLISKHDPSGKKALGEYVRVLPVRERRRQRALEPDEVTDPLFGTVTVPKKRTKKDVLKIHPNDPEFRTALDACQALALRYIEAGEGAGGIGSAKALSRQQRWSADSAPARLMEALVHAAPEAVRRLEKKGDRSSAAALFPEFRAWHALLKPLFGMQPPDWSEPAPPEDLFTDLPDEEAEDQVDLDDEETDEDED